MIGITITKLNSSLYRSINLNSIVRRAFAAGKEKKKTEAKPVKPVKAELNPVGTVIPISVYKDQKDPVELSDDKYPDWLWELTKEPETLEEISRKGTAGLSHAEIRNYNKRRKRGLIKEKNIELKSAPK